MAMYSPKALEKDKAYQPAASSRRVTALRLGSVVAVLTFLVVLMNLLALGDVEYGDGPNSAIRWLDRNHSAYTALKELQADAFRRINGTIHGHSPLSRAGREKHITLRKNDAKEEVDEDQYLFEDEEDGVHVFHHVLAHLSVPDTIVGNRLKNELLKDAWLFRESLIMYQSETAKKARNARNTSDAFVGAQVVSSAFRLGIVYGVSGTSKVGGQGQNVSSEDSVFQKYMVEIAHSVQSLRLVLKSNIGVALIVDKPMDALKSEHSKLFDYIIYNPVLEDAHDSFPGGLGWIIKLLIMLYTPFQRTLYVDGDTRFCSDPKEIFDGLKYSAIALARDVRSPHLHILRGQNLDFNGGVILYRKIHTVATLMHEIVRVLLNHPGEGDQKYWGIELEDFESFGNVRYHVLPPRFHFQPCRHDKGECFVDGAVVLLHGRCWLGVHDPPNPAQFCDYLNSYQDTRFIHTDCSKLRVYKVDIEPANKTQIAARLQELPVPGTRQPTK
ncbi:hypothetical protein FVE85_1693 [Porphyridium purpureum]|uniref:Uncharacterized protein n=1 Tax=Porphyridium purpureum TaxID=35688 RepID=A0A5J4YWM2_PORPP|nr:hypothetical protein FVE85_1693 [Porphyridium purpureum]|eukprot:POR5714..scf209_3